MELDLIFLFSVAIFAFFYYASILAEGWEVIVFIPSKEEDEDRITCGNALLSVEYETN